MIDWNGVLKSIWNGIKGTGMLIIVLVFLGCALMVMMGAWAFLSGQLDAWWMLLFAVPGLIILAIFKNIR